MRAASGAILRPASSVPVWSGWRAERHGASHDPAPLELTCRQPATLDATSSMSSTGVHGHRRAAADTRRVRHLWFAVTSGDASQTEPNKKK